MNNEDFQKLQIQLDMEKKINENNTDAYMKLLHTSQALEQRIDNAIDYIKEKAINNCWIDQYEANDLINILKGE